MPQILIVVSVGLLLRDYRDRKIVSKVTGCHAKQSSFKSLLPVIIEKKDCTVSEFTKAACCCPFPKTIWN